MKIKNIIFDIGGVLMDYVWDEYINSVFDDNTAEKINTAMWDSGFWTEADKGFLTEEQLLNLICDAIPELKAEIHEAYDSVDKYMKKREWVIQLMVSLKEQGYRVLYLSNFSHHDLDSNSNALDFLPYMDGGIFSCDVHIIKPNPEMYLSLIRKYDLEPKECLYIEDNDENIAVANTFGFRSIRFDNYEQMISDLNKELVEIGICGGNRHGNKRS